MPKTIRTPVFNRYDVLDKIGSGGMGTVYKARDTHLDRSVALKLLPPGLQEHPETLERFRREAQALARLKHPSVAAVYDANVERGFPYLVLEFIEGKNLERILADGGPMAIPDVVRMGVEIAEAIDHISQHHIVHRDIKTSNIIVEPEGRAVLADFGIALVATLPRISHGALGTPEYMSPEQADGKPLDSRTDVYRFGVVLYECLTGAVPFERGGEGLAELTTLMTDILHTAPPPLRQRRADVPGWLAAVIDRCLAKKPEDRYASGAEIADALRKGRMPRRLGRANGTSPTRGRFGKATIAEHVEEAGPASSAPDGLVMISHIQPVAAVAFSPSSRRMATASGDRAIRLWDVATGRLLHTLLGHKGHISSMTFSFDGQYLASGDREDGVVHLWNARSGQLRHTLDHNNAQVWSVAFSPDSRQLASGGSDGIVRLWEVKQRRLIRTISAHGGYALSVAFSLDGRQLASGGSDGAVRTWDVASGRPLNTPGEGSKWMNAVAFSPDRQCLAAGNGDGAVRIWDLGTNKLLRTMRGHRGYVMAIAFSPDGTHLASAGRDQAVCVWEVDSGRLIRRLEDHQGEVMTVAYSPNGKYLATGSRDTTVRMRPFTNAGKAKRSRLKRFLGLF